MVALSQNMKQEASLCPVQCDEAMPMQEARRLDHTTMKVLVAYTAHEVIAGSRVQRSAQLSDSV